MKKTKVDRKIFLKNKEWSFSKKIAPLFDYHINKSIPFYKEFQWLCNEVSDYFIKDKSNVYDLGCSTGSFTKRLALRHKNKKKLKIYAIDVVAEMINFAKKKNKLKNVNYTKKQINKLKFNKNNIII